MVLCDSCLQHVKTRFQTDATPLINFSQSIIKQLTDSQIQRLIGIAENGIMVCKECMNLCVKEHPECDIHHRKNSKIYRHRMVEDNRAITSLKNELQRRKNVRGVLAQVKPNFPSIPTNNPWDEENGHEHRTSRKKILQKFRVVGADNLVRTLNSKGSEIVGLPSSEWFLIARSQGNVLTVTIFRENGNVISRRVREKIKKDLLDTIPGDAIDGVEDEEDDEKPYEDNFFVPQEDVLIPQIELLPPQEEIEDVPLNPLNYWADDTGDEEDGMGPEQIWEQYGKDIDKRLFNDMTFDTSDRVVVDDDAYTVGHLPQKFLESDPSRNNKYLEWIVKSYIEGGIKRFEDLSRTKLALMKYDWLLRRKLIKGQWGKDINGFCGLAGCETGGKKKKKKDGLDSFLKNYVEELKVYEKEEEIQIQEKDVELVYEDDEVKVIVPKTKDASCKYGRGTQWCTAATKGENMFDHYNKEGPLYIIMGKKDGRKYQFHKESGQYMDEQDEEVLPTEVYVKYLGLTNIPNFMSDYHKKVVNILANPKNLITYIDNGEFYIDEGIVDIENSKKFEEEIYYSVLEFALLHNLGLDFAQKLVDYGADVNYKGQIEDRTILQESFYDLEKLKFLVKNNVYIDPYVIFTHINSKEEEYFDKQDIFVENTIYLIENGLDVNARVDGHSILGMLSIKHFEDEEKLLKLAKVMIEHGFKLQRQDISDMSTWGRWTYPKVIEYIEQFLKEKNEDSRVYFL